MTWRRPGDKPLSEPMMVNLPMHMCVTRPRWVRSQFTPTLDLCLSVWLSDCLPVCLSVCLSVCLMPLFWVDSFHICAHEQNVRTSLMNFEVVQHLQGHHYDDVIMGAMASQITSLTIVFSTVYSNADQRKHQSFASLACVGDFTGAGEFPAQRVSNAEKFSIWWRHLVSNKIAKIWYILPWPLYIVYSSASCFNIWNKWLLIWEGVSSGTTFWSYFLMKNI